ncbi:Cys-tRNA(Pro)/Cys-tRNA(Cys) deacylase [Litorimonas taeanensis]|uniref:Cys-tRNA(Pro)/Cys-tRNA(Cys) deacylase n=1 Tax=Litorimonas taeanensis TaxID=568099 RepID=A0A420WF69_9PROT|nr:Cys-tRNA(Pro) deacylase [Litorimonas taeanensis]RKQ69634.1 Cys-tRNA(Pro)/Cys-tRNA(Cys) deacylase [Litorimonas taeanensis]
MTPGVKFLTARKIPFSLHEYAADPAADSYGLEAASALNLPPEQVFKTLVVSLSGDAYAVAILPVSQMLSMKRIAKSVGVKKAQMADGADVERMTGYVLGGVSPLGQKKRLQTVIDKSAQNHSTIFISGGKRGLEIEMPPEALAQCLNAKFSELTA